MLKTTIIVPVYNTKIKKLERCFKSIADIDGLFECLIVDDGSEQYIEKFCEKIVDNNCLFRYIKKKNGGAGSARNIGIEKAKGDYLMFVDSDDMVNSKVIEKQLKEENVDLVLSDLEYITEKRRIVWSALPYYKKITIESIIEELCIHGRLNGPVCKLIKKEFIFRNNIRFNENMCIGEDAVFFYDLLSCEPTISYCRECSYYYFIDGRTSNSRINRYYDKMLENYKFMYNRLCKLILSINDDYTGRKNNIFALQKHIKLLFDYTMSLSIQKDILDSQKDKIRKSMYEENVLKFMDESTIGMMTRLRYYLLSTNRWKIIKAISYIRKVFLLCKYGG